VGEGHRSPHLPRPELTRETRFALDSGFSPLNLNGNSPYRINFKRLCGGGKRLLAKAYSRNMVHCRLIGISHTLEW